MSKKIFYILFICLLVLTIAGLIIYSVNSIETASNTGESFGLTLIPFFCFCFSVMILYGEFDIFCSLKYFLFERDKRSTLKTIGKIMCLVFNMCIFLSIPYSNLDYMLLFTILSVSVHIVFSVTGIIVKNMGKD